MFPWWLSRSARVPIREPTKRLTVPAKTRSGEEPTESASGYKNTWRECKCHFLLSRNQITQNALFTEPTHFPVIQKNTTTKKTHPKKTQANMEIYMEIQVSITALVMICHTAAFPPPPLRELFSTRVITDRL